MALTLRTERLVLREWRECDAAAFFAMSADPGLTEFLLPPDAAWVSRARDHWRLRGFGQWVVELPGVAPLIGVVGLAEANPAVPGGPAIEIAWRLARPYWGCGYATEAARAARDDGFGRLGLEQIIAITSAGNTRSRRVMERLGMRRDPAEDFDFAHPRLPAGHPLRPHVLYRLRRRRGQP
jgi:ribosomal-protein-alanine N-acetyltransferase